MSGSSRETIRRLGKAIDAKTRALYLETIGNPRLNVPDLEASRGRPRHGIPLDRGQYLWRGGLPLPPHRTRGRHRHPLRHQMDRRARHLDRRRDRRRRTVRLGEREVPALHRTEPRVSRIEVLGSVRSQSQFGNIAFIIRARVEQLRDLGACLRPSTPSSSCRGWRPSRSAWSATVPERPAACPVAGGAPEGRLGLVSGLAPAPVPRTGKAVPP